MYTQYFVYCTVYSTVNSDQSESSNEQTGCSHSKSEMRTMVTIPRARVSLAVSIPPARRGGRRRGAAETRATATRSSGRRMSAGNSFFN